MRVTPEAALETAHQMLQCRDTLQFLHADYDQRIVVWQEALLNLLARRPGRPLLSIAVEVALRLDDDQCALWIFAAVCDLIDRSP